MVIEELKAKEIATRFLEQHYSIIVTTAILDGDKWIISAKVGFLREQIKTVIVDAQTGQILKWT